VNVKTDSEGNIYSSFNPFWKSLRLRNSAWVFLGVNFWSRNFLGFVGSPRDFFGFWFLPPFDHPRHLKLGVPPGLWWRKMLLVVTSVILAIVRGQICFLMGSSHLLLLLLTFLSCEVSNLECIAIDMNNRSYKRTTLRVCMEQSHNSSGSPSTYVSAREGHDCISVE